jgi:hypothetical protein
MEVTDAGRRRKAVGSELVEPSFFLLRKVEDAVKAWLLVRYLKLL